MKIQVLVARNKNNNKVLGAVGISDKSSIVRFSFTIPPEVFTNDIVEEFGHDFDETNEGKVYSFECEPYHIIKEFCYIKIDIENIDIV